MVLDLVLKEAKIYVNNRVIEGGIAIDEGRIVRIAKEANLPSASEKINLNGMLVLPGVIDAHVHLRNQELSYKEDFYSGTCAAANGGVTLVIDMPNNKPVTMSLETLRERMERASRKIVVNVSFFSAFPKDIDEIKQIIYAGAKAFKIFLAHKVGGLNPDDERRVVSAFREVAAINVPVAIHAEDGFLLSKKLKEIGDRDDINAYLEVHSSEAEIKGILRAIRFVRESGARAHICHVSTSEGLKTILREKSRDLPISCEVTPHHLLLSERDLRRIGNVALVNPPLRPLSDVLYLQQALKNGLVDIVASDHAPHAFEEKDTSSIWDVSAGIPGIETMLPLMLTMFNKGQIPLQTLVKVLSENPSRIFGFKDRGQIAEGFYADLVVVDLKREWTINSPDFYSKAKFSPFDGWRVMGKPLKTFVNGILVMDEGEIVAKPGCGRIVR
ncbi:MAG: dihydroorotase family protein [Candidatus Bathyarchaeia archaeon]